MKVKVDISGYNIVASGVIVLGQSQNGFIIKIEDINLDFEFITDGDKPSSSFKLIDEKNVKFTLKNFGNPLGISYELNDILNIGSDVLSVVIYVHANSMLPVRRLVSYTITSKNS